MELKFGMVWHVNVLNYIWYVDIVIKNHEIQFLFVGVKFEIAILMSTEEQHVVQIFCKFIFL